GAGDKGKFRAALPLGRSPGRWYEQPTEPEADEYFVNVRKLAKVEALAEALLAEGPPDEVWNLMRITRRARWAHKDALVPGFHAEDADRKQRERAGYASALDSLDRLAEESRKGQDGSTYLWELANNGPEPGDGLAQSASSRRFSLTAIDVAAEA